MIRRILQVSLFCGLSVLSHDALAQTKQERYQNCMTLARSQPNAGFDAGLAWQGVGGGEAARHCLATALFFMGHYPQAAQRFEDMAEATRSSAAFKAQLLSQAANSWFLADDANRARAVMTTAIELDPDQVDYYVDRARMRAAQGGQAEALADLTLALQRDENHGDALLFRGSLHRQAMALDAALQDLNRVIALDPSHEVAYLERGMVARLQEREEAARADWITVLEIAPDSESAELARRNLELLDVDTKK